jgi:hypothetical protein
VARILILIALAFVATCALGAPAPKPAFPNRLVLTQGTQTQRFLDIPNQACSNGYQETRTSGVRRFKLLNCAANGSFVQFPENGGPIYSQWVYPAPPPVCMPMPAPVITTNQCSITNPGTQGTWTQTATYGPASPQVPPDGCWAIDPPLPATAPADACTQSQPPPFQWQAPFSVASYPIPSRPAKGGSYVTPYGTTVTRVTDAQADAGVAWLANWYNRFEAVNADGSLLLAFQPNGFWDVFDARTNAFVKRLAGPGGDAEIQWHPTDANVFYYVPTNGGTEIDRYDVAANTHAVLYDFTTAVHALWPDVVHCWTKSEGSPSQDGRYWVLMCETSGWVTRGFVKVDLVAKSIVWSKTNTGARPDNVTITPNGIWAVISGLAPLGTNAYATDGTGRTCHAHDTVEHADIGVLSNGHSFIVLPDFTSGTIKAMDLDTCARLDTSWPAPVRIYNNPWLDNVPAHSCANCGVHPSAKAYNTPGWVLLGFYGEPVASLTPPSNVIALNVETGRFYGVSASYSAHGDYWDEAHCFVDRNFAHAWCTENWNHPGTDPSYSIDIVRIDIPALPQ